MDAPIFRFDRYIPPGPHRLPARPRVSLEITRGRVRQRVRAVSSRVFLIGAASDCDLVLGDLSFPEAYAYLFVEGAEVTIRRLGTGPELIVAGESVESAELFHGDKLAFGPFELQILIEELPVSANAISEESTPPQWMPEENGAPFIAGHQWSPA
jgi:hypothetical protein